MRAIVNEVIQLQDLSLIREEQRVARGGAHLGRLDASISAMAKEVAAKIGPEFETLRKKDRIMIVPITDQFCAGCGMQLPISLIQAVKTDADFHSCPQCARILYYPEGAPRRLGKTRRRTEPTKVGISRFSSHTLMIPSLKATDRESAIAELAYCMEEAGFVDKADQLVEMSLQREAVVSTAVDHGVAFPHVRGVEGGGITMALGISSKGIKFDLESRNLSRIIFFIVIPTAASAFYLRLLAGLTETLMVEDARKALMAAKTEDALWKALSKVTRKTIK